MRISDWSSDVCSSDLFAAAAPARSITSYSGTPLANRCCSAFRICSAVRMGAPDILLIRLRSNGGGEAIGIIGDCDVNHIVSGKGELRLFSSIGRNTSSSVRYNAKTAKAAPGRMKNEPVAFRPDQ